MGAVDYDNGRISKSAWTDTHSVPMLYVHYNGSGGVFVLFLCPVRQTRDLEQTLSPVTSVWSLSSLMLLWIRRWEPGKAFINGRPLFMCHGRTSIHSSCVRGTEYGVAFVCRGRCGRWAGVSRIVRGGTTWDLQDWVARSPFNWILSDPKKETTLAAEHEPAQTPCLASTKHSTSLFFCAVSVSSAPALLQHLTSTFSPSLFHSPHHLANNKSDR